MKLIWEKFRSGDRTSFETIYNEFSDVLFAYGSKITHDRELLKDAIQDVFVNIYKYDLELKNPEALEFYLFKTLKRILFRKLSEQKRIHYTNNDFSQFELTVEIDSDLIKDEVQLHRLHMLQKILSSLNASQRELLYLKFTSGLSYAEIGSLLDMKADTAKKQVYRLLESLRLKVGADLLDLLAICYRA